MTVDYLSAINQGGSGLNITQIVDSLVEARTRQQRGISPPPNTVEQVNTDQMDANQSRVTIEQAAVDEFKQKELYKTKKYYS